MNFSFERIGVVIGAVIGAGTIIAGLGYGWPWYAHADGIKLEQIEKSNHANTEKIQSAIIADVLQNQADSCDDRVDLLTLRAKEDKSPALKDMAARSSKHCDRLHSDADKAQKVLLK